MVIVGGDPDDSTSAKVWSPKKQCCLPPLMPHTMFSPTVNSLSHRVIACGGSTCFELKKKPRAEIAKEAKAFHAARKKNAGSRMPEKVKESPRGKWQQLNTLEWRVAHTIAIVPDGLLFFGGSGSPNTTELVPKEREGGKTRG